VAPRPAQPAARDAHTHTAQHEASGQYRAYPGANCRVGHGASRDIDPYSPVSVTVAECTARCDHDPKCTCVTHRRSDGACWKRAGCSAAAFEYAPPTPTLGNGSTEGDGYDAYVNTARHLDEWRTHERARAQSELTRRSVDEPLCSRVNPRVSYPS